MSKGSSLSSLKKVLKYVGKHKLLLIFSLLLSLVSVACTLLIPVFAGKAIDCIIGKGNVDFDGLKNHLLVISLLALSGALTQWIANTVNNRISFEVVRDVRNSAIAKIQILPLSYIDSRPVGETVSRVISDADQFADGLLMGFTQFFSGIITIFGTLAFMLLVNVKITLVVVLLTPLSLFVARFIAQKTFSLFRLQSETRGEETSCIDEMIGGRKIVSAFSREGKFLEEFDEINSRYAKHSLKATFFSSLTNPSTRFINSMVYAGVGLAGAFAAINGGISIGVLSCFLSYANQYTKPFNEISGVIAELQNALACADRLFELIEQPAQKPDGENAVILENTSGKVTFENVDFSYDKSKELIKKFNLTAESGQRIAIVGPTGCGKTTIINLLMRFYDADNGKISVDGIDINDIARHSLRKQFGMVLQDTWIKEGTVRENIAIGRPDATIEEITEAAKKSHALSFIKRLPNGFDTVISDDSSLLSQGQKQLLCISRVMLCLPPILILDEATSSIDTRTEIRIQKAFHNMMQGRTSFIVAHRLSTVKNADMVIVMKDGKIIEQGTHSQLMDNDGFYKMLYNSRLSQ